VPADLSYEPAYRFEQVLIAPHDHPLAGKRPSRWKTFRPIR
jgi:DNA-binding transcriptional LysR family regulator